jgi:hypothetical protein
MMGQRGVLSSDFGWGQVAGCCKHVDEHSDYVKWSIARRPAVHEVRCWAVYWRRSCVRGSGVPEVDCMACLPAAWSGAPGFKFRLVDGLCRDLAWFISNSH